MRLFYAVQGVLLLTSSMAFAFGPVQTYNGGSSRSETVSSDGDDGPLPVVQAVSRGGVDDYNKWLQKVSYDQVDGVSEADLDPYVNFRPDLRPSELTKWSNRFDNVIVVNTAPAPGGQKMDVYRFGQKVATFPVSTGQDKYVCDRMKDKSGVDQGKWRQVWTGTKTGYYPAGRCDADHRSGEFDDAMMTHACQIHDGTFSHKGSAPKLLGVQRASHACVRLSDKDSKQLYDWITLSGGPINPQDKQWWGQCPPTQNLTPELCQGQPGVAALTKKYQAEAAALVLKGASESGADNSPLPYASMPQVPVTKPDGTWQADPDTAEIKTQPGARSIYVVQCIDASGKDCSHDQPLTREQMQNPRLPRGPNQPPAPHPAETLQACCDQEVATRGEISLASCSKAGGPKTGMQQFLGGIFNQQPIRN